jgi:hypothetical protein
VTKTERALAKFFHFAFEATILFGFVAGGVAAYYQTVFYNRWREYMRAIGAPETIMWNNSSFAIFSSDLPEECRAIRRKLVISFAAFFGLFVIGILILSSAWTLGYFPEA